jgi:hypothetical protein
MKDTKIGFTTSKPIITLLTLMAGLVAVNPPTLANNVQGAVVTRTEGESQLMIKKVGSAPTPAGAKSIMFEKDTYFIRPVKNGDRPANGDVVSTGKNGKVRLIFRNGDQVTVTPGTAFKFSWDPKTDRNAIAEIVYGDIRAVIQPEGPRSGMKVQTKSAVMGVRGTDFYVSAWSKDAGSKVSVMRGKVAVAPKVETPEPAPAAQSGGKSAQPIQASKPVVEPKEVEVSAGTTGVVKAAAPAPATNLSLTDSGPAAPASPVVEVASTSKQELVVIQNDSKVAKPKQDDTAMRTDPVATEIAKLEATSVETTLQDVKRHDPELYAKLQEENKKGKIADADLVQSETVKKIFVTAPSEKKEPRKPTLQDLDTGGDIYDKYKWERN